MSTITPTYDVFVSHSLRDQDFADDVVKRIEAEGLQPFHDAAIPAGKEVSQEIWDALAESHAFIVIVSPESIPDAMGMVELGAATAWNKPIFVVLNGPASSQLPELLQNYQAYPRNRVDELLAQIRRNFEPISEEDREILVESYREFGVPTDQLGQSPRELQKLVKKFDKKTEKQFSGPRLLTELLRLRKQGKLPKLRFKQ